MQRIKIKFFLKMLNIYTQNNVNVQYKPIKQFEYERLDNKKCMNIDQIKMCELF